MTPATPAFLDVDGHLIGGSIAEAGFRCLGGVEQWVMIRGEHIGNPPLILLHGGPGLSETAFFRYFNSALERSFTVVYWDQRGAGKSYHRRVPRDSMTVERMLGDLDDLVDLVRQRLGQAKVVLFGHSWGSALGALYAARHGDKVAAYVGSGQIGDWHAGERDSYAYSLAEAERRRRRRAVRALLAIGPPPHDARQLWAARRWLSRLEGGMPISTLLRVIHDVPEASFFDLPRVYRGFRFSLEAMWKQVRRIDLRVEAPAFAMPVFFLIGRRDHWVPAAQSVAYFEALTAPSKQLVWFDASGHEPFIDEADRFNDTMVTMVRPAVAP